MGNKNSKIKESFFLEGKLEFFERDMGFPPCYSALTNERIRYKIKGEHYKNDGQEYVLICDG